MNIRCAVLDLSHHNDGPGAGPIDFAAIAGYGVRGIIHKASQGDDYVDRRYAERRAAARAAGLLWGAYHFADNAQPERQVRQFLDAADPDGETLMALDYEPYARNTMSLDQARAFLQLADQELGRRLVLYSGSLIKQELGDNPDTFLGSHRLWLAQYGPTPRVPAAWPAPWLWQFSGDGVHNTGFHIPGVDPRQAERLDMNSYAGTDELLAAEWAS